MDVQAIANLFATSLNSDPNVRKAGEIEIRRIGNQEGVPSALMQVIGNEGVDPAVRQACAVFLKNRIAKAWFVNPDNERAEGTPNPIAPSDRLFIKQNILALLVAAGTRPLRLQLCACLKTLVTYDFPADWPTLVDDILVLLRSTDPRSIYGGCFALLELVKSTRFRIENNIMPQIAEKVFPTLVDLGTNLASNLTPDNADCLHIILKTYKASTQSSLSPHQQSSQSIMAWGRLLFQVVNVQLPPGVSIPGTTEDWQKSEWWKAKKWAFNTLNRLFERYGNPSQLPASLKKEVSAFAEHFVTSFAPEIFKTYLHQTELYASKQIWLSEKVLSAIIRFFTACIKPKSTWVLLKPHTENLISGIVFPTIVFNEERAEQWENDPLEFVRRSIEMDDVVSPSAAGLTFILQLATSRPKATFMGILKFVNTVLSTPTASPNEKYGALCMMSALGGVILATKEVKSEMQGFLTKFVVPELASPHGYMRQIACEVIGTFDRFDIEWTDVSALEITYTSVARVVSDTELPVRVSSVMALMHLIRHESVRQGLSSHVAQIMQALFALSDETDMDVISEAMESFIEIFQKELVPASVEIIGRLCQNYARLVTEYAANQSSGPSPDDLSSTASASIEDDKTMAMMGLAKTMEAVLDAVDSVEDPKPTAVILQMQELVVPIINLTFEKSVIELFDSMFSLVDSFTFTLRVISQSMWGVFEGMYKLFKTVAIDYLDEMLPSLDNFIDFGKDVFSSSPEYRRMAIDFYTTALTSPSLGDADRINGCNLGESIMLNLRGHVDEYFETIISTGAELFVRKGGSVPLRLAILNLLINTLLYSPSAALQIMQKISPVLPRSLFDAWFIALNSKDGKGLPRVHDKRLSIVTLSTLLEMDGNSVPPELKDGWPGLLAGVLSVFQTLPDAIKKREALLIGDIDVEDDEDEDLIGERSLNDGGGDDDDVWDEDDEYLGMLAEEGARLRAKRGRGSSLDVDSEGASDDDDSDDSSIDEELNVETPLEAIDPYIRFKAALTAFQLNNPLVYQVATTSLNVEQQTQLVEVMTAAQNAEAISSA